MRWDLDDGGIRGAVLPGASLGELISSLGEPDDKFRRTPDDRNVILAYDSLGLHATIDAKNCMLCLSIFPRNEVYIGGVQVLGKNLEEVTKTIPQHYCLHMEDAGLWVGRVYALLVEVEGLVDAVEIYERDG